MHCVNGKGIGNDISWIERESKRVMKGNPKYWNGKMPNGEWAEERRKQIGWVRERELTQNAFQLVFIQFDAVAARRAKATMVLGWIKNIRRFSERQRAFWIVFVCQSLLRRTNCVCMRKYIDPYFHESEWRTSTAYQRWSKTKEEL